MAFLISQSAGRRFEIACFSSDQQSKTVRHSVWFHTWQKRSSNLYIWEGGTRNFPFSLEESQCYSRIFVLIRPCIPWKSYRCNRSSYLSLKCRTDRWYRQSTNGQQRATSVLRLYRSLWETDPTSRLIYYYSVNSFLMSLWSQSLVSSLPQTSTMFIS